MPESRILARTDDRGTRLGSHRSAKAPPLRRSALPARRDKMQSMREPEYAALCEGFATSAAVESRRWSVAVDDTWTSLVGAYRRRVDGGAQVPDLGRELAPDARRQEPLDRRRPWGGGG